MQRTNAQLSEFIDNSPCAYQAVDSICRRLLAEDYVKLDEGEHWDLIKGGKYFVVRGEASVIAFSIPEVGWRGYSVVAAHTDSPCFRIKEGDDLREQGFGKLNVEKYGGMILSSWLDRPLSVAGRLAIADSDGVKSVLVHSRKDLAVIPNLAIHMNPKINEGVNYDPQVDLLPVISMGERQLLDELAIEASVSKEKIVGTDLYLYLREDLRELGLDQEFILSPRLDDLQCVFAGLTGFLASKPRDHVNMLCCFHNEEVGSGTRQGAGSTFFEDVLMRINECFGGSREDYLCRIHNSFLLSADNAHSVHPNHVEKADVVNRPKINGGVVIKYNGAGKYITDGVTGGIVKELCKKQGIPWQDYFNRSNIAGGSTLGHILTQRVAMQGADIGLAQLSMHSCLETAGAKDTDYMIQLFQGFYD